MYAFIQEKWIWTTNILTNYDLMAYPGISSNRVELAMDSMGVSAPNRMAFTGYERIGNYMNDMYK